MIGYIKGQAGDAGPASGTSPASRGGGGNWGGSYLAIPKASASTSSEAVDADQVADRPRAAGAVFAKAGNFPSTTRRASDPSVAQRDRHVLRRRPDRQDLRRGGDEAAPVQILGPKDGAIKNAISQGARRGRAAGRAPDQAWNRRVGHRRRHERLRGRPDPQTVPHRAVRGHPGPHRTSRPPVTPWRSRSPTRSRRTRTQRRSLPGPGRAASAGTCWNGARAVRRTSPPFFLLFFALRAVPAALHGLGQSLHRVTCSTIDKSSGSGSTTTTGCCTTTSFWNALRNTFTIGVLSTVPQLLMALGLAHLLNYKLRGRTFLRVVMLMPYADLGRGRDAGLRAALRPRLRPDQLAAGLVGHRPGRLAQRQLDVADRHLGDRDLALDRLQRADLPRRHAVDPERPLRGRRDRRRQPLAAVPARDAARRCGRRSCSRSSSPRSARPSCSASRCSSAAAGTTAAPRTSTRRSACHVPAGLEDRPPRPGRGDRRLDDVPDHHRRWSLRQRRGSCAAGRTEDALVTRRHAAPTGAPPDAAAPPPAPASTCTRGPLTYVVLALVALGSIFPLYWTIVAASHPISEMAQVPPPLAARRRPVHNISTALDQADIGKAMRQLARSSSGDDHRRHRAASARSPASPSPSCASAAATSCSALTHRHDDDPAAARRRPAVHRSWPTLGWAEQLQAVILPTLVTAFGVFFMRQYLVQALPDELLEAARVDGATTLRDRSGRIVLPDRPARRWRCSACSRS